MKVVILAGGFGTRISEESHLKPKPMIEIGDRPILWHIMKIYSHYGFNDFIICLGFKGYVIKEYFSNYFLHMSNVTFDMAHNRMEVHEQNVEPWRVTLVDTGLESMTGGRVKLVAPYIGNETFLMTYGDGVANINVHELIAFHKQHGKLATVTTTKPAGRFGAIHLESDNSVSSFHEKPEGDGGWINGGFFVLEPGVINRIPAATTVFEKEPLEGLANDGELVAYKHRGFWQPMDTLRDKMHLEELWKSGKPPWKVW